MTEQEFLKRYTYNPATDSLGHGGFGDVFRAYDNYLDRYVAIKVAQVRGGIEMLRLRNEVEKASKLLHPNVAHYEECHTMLYPTGEFDFAVMQYYEDGSLDKLFGSDALTREASYDILTQILEGLAYLHSEGIIHRDLKPQNVLIARRGDRYIPKITDFGISKQLDEGQSSAVSNSVLGGTRAYASPEQLKERTIRKNTDLWSFGVIAYQMLVGALPFDCGSYSPTSEEGRQEQFRQMMSGILPDAVASIPEPWQRLIRECLTVDNERRIAHAEDCLAIISGEEATAVAIEVDNPATQLDGDSETAVEIKPQPEPKVEPKVEPKSVSASKPTEPKKSKWWLWLLLLLIVAGGAAAWFMSGPKDEPTPTPEPIAVVADSIADADGKTAESIAEEQSAAPAPVLRLTSNSRVTAEHSGSNGTIRYTLENPVSGVNISVSDNANWLTTSVSGSTISYTASANESQSSRTATITVSYGDQGFEVAITQNGKPAPDPVLRLTSDNPIRLSYCGIFDDTFGYTLENPVSGVNISVSDDASWRTTRNAGGYAIGYGASANESQSSRTATITVSYGDQSFEVAITQRGKPAHTRGTINGHEWVDLGLPSGLKWATCNVGASNPGDYGNYYAWGEITPALNNDYSEANCSTLGQNIGDIAGTSRDAARQNWGGSWRMPRRREINELVDNCTLTWTTQNGHNGYKVTGPNGNSIFLPATGRRVGTSSYQVGSFGDYWCSTPNPNDGDTLRAGVFGIGNGTFRGYTNRYYGNSVRPVLE